MAKTFTHIGAAIYKGKDKFRFTHGRVDARIKTMTKEGFENIEFIPLPSEMTKDQAFKTDVAAELAARRGLSLPVTEPEAASTDTASPDQLQAA